MRTKYESSEDIDRLAGAVKDNLLGCEDRTGLLYDAYALAKSGAMDPAKMLVLLKAYENEEEMPVWDAIAGCLNGLHSILEGSKEGAVLLPGLANLASKLIAKRMASIGWDAKESKWNVCSIASTFDIYQILMFFSLCTIPMYMPCLHNHNCKYPILLVCVYPVLIFLFDLPLIPSNPAPLDDGHLDTLLRANLVRLFAKFRTRRRGHAGHLSVQVRRVHRRPPALPRRAACRPQDSGVQHRAQERPLFGQLPTLVRHSRCVEHHGGEEGRVLISGLGLVHGAEEQDPGVDPVGGHQVAGLLLPHLWSEVE